MSKILLVEDDPMISEIYQRKFESAGFEVGIARTGKEVVRKVREESFDLVLLDMVLPEMGGLDVLNEIKTNGAYNPEMRVIIFSNLTDGENQNKAFELGADGYIPKTQFSPSDLILEIKRRLTEFGEQKKNVARKNGKDGGGATHENSGKKKIMFVEDEEIFLDMFGKKLEEDFSVEYARNGAWGLKEILKGGFDLVILDMVMPTMNGKEMIERLKLEDSTKNLPLIVLSASVTEEEKNEVEKLGISDFFLKTRILPSDLSKRIKELLK